MQRRTLFSVVAAAAVAGMFGFGPAQAQQTIKIGVVGPKTGPLAAPGAVTHWSNFRLWAQQVNARGGLRLKDGQRRIELIEYDDQAQPAESIKAVERLATQDKVDFIMAPYSTGANLAVAPIFDRHGYPQLAQSAVTNQMDALIARYPGLFFVQGTTNAFAETAANVLKKMKDDGQIGGRLAMVNVADAFGIEMANAARPIFAAAGFNIVYSTSYPLGTQDLAPVVKAAKAANPDAFVAWSYPPDTFGLAQQAKVEGLNVKAYYSAVATAFPSFKKTMGDSAEGILGAGGVQDSPELRKYYADLKAATGVDGDFWGNPVYFAMCQIVEQAIEGVGSLDRKAITEYMKKNKFKTLYGEIDLSGQRMKSLWTVGQWQGDTFHGVAGVGDMARGGKPVKIKTGW